MSPRFSLSELFLRTQTDERLCLLAADGHQTAFAVLVERHRAALLRTAGRVGGAQRAEDVVQEALLRAFRALVAGTRVEQPTAWLHQIVRHTAINQIARERCQTETLPADLADPVTVEEAHAEALLAQGVLAQIAALPDRQRVALIETELQGRSRRDIAADLGLTEGAVRQLVHRARSTVRVALTAITPYPLAAWVARRGPGPGAGAIASLTRHAPPPGSARSGLFEGVAAGSAAGGGALLKGGAALLAIGALGGGVAVRALAGRHHAPGLGHHITHETARPAGPAAAMPAVAGAGASAGAVHAVAVRDWISEAAVVTRRAAHPPRPRSRAARHGGDTSRRAERGDKADGAASPGGASPGGSSEGGAGDDPSALPGRTSPAGTETGTDQSGRTPDTSSESTGPTSGESSASGTSGGSTPSGGSTSSGDAGAAADANGGPVVDVAVPGVGSSAGD